MTKEYEAVLAADVDAAKVHFALTLAGAEAGPPSLLDPFGAATTMKRCQVPFLSPSDRRLAGVRWAAA